jgi:CHASE2 domain-containing sensor protein
MRRINILSFWKDFSDSGYCVSLKICEDGDRLIQEKGIGWLPTHLDLESSYQMWKTSFKTLKTRSYEDWEIDDGIVTNRATFEDTDLCLEWARNLESDFQEWLQDSSNSTWREIQNTLIRELAEYSENIRLVIKADSSLRKLPWEEWSLLKLYPNLEIILSLENYDREQRHISSQSTSRVDILALFGNSQNLDLQPDREALEQLKKKGATLDFLKQPTAQEFIQKLRRVEGWSILFFAGHSGVKNERGKICINEQVNLEVEQFKDALQEAVRNGLKIAIFNSCQGFDLASEAANLNVPIIIYMQEDIHDRVAPSFLKYLLTDYSEGRSLNCAFRNAKSKLEEFAELPGIKFLPKIIYRNPIEEPPTWKELQGKKQINRRSPNQPIKRPNLLAVMMISLLVSVVVTGLRSLGFLEQWQLQAYDHLMRMRPDEGLDSRLLLVTVDANDVAAQPIEERNNASISEPWMEQLLQKLEQYQPRVIGLDVYRENPVKAKYKDLANRLRTSDRIIAICKQDSSKGPGKLPPPEVSHENLGFNNVLDDDDGIIRRHLIEMGKRSTCPTFYSWSLQLAARYLADEGIKLEFIHKDKYYRFSQTILKVLEKDSGGYHNLESYGHQLILNYRATRQIAQTVSLTEVVEDRIDPNLVKDRIVLIGTIDPSHNDHRWLTVYSKSELPIRYMTGIEIQAHMVSQLLSAVLDRRPLIWWWSKPTETLWIWGWSVLGGLSVILWRSQLYQRLTGVTVLGLLYLSCFGLLLKGGWIPLVPSALSLVATHSSVVAYTIFLNRQSIRKIKSSDV